MAFLAWWLPYDMGVRPEPVVALCATAAAALLLLAAARRRLAVAWLALAVAGAGAVAHTGGVVLLGVLVAGLPLLVPVLRGDPGSVPGSADPRGRIPLPVLRGVAVASALATALLLGFADGALRDFLRGQAVTGAVFTPDGWADEAGRYAFLLDPIPMGSFARRAAVLTCLLALAWFAVLAVAARARRVPLPAPLVLTASATALGFVSLGLTPSKWTHHFGTLAGVGAAFLGLLLVTAAPLTRDVLRGARLPPVVPLAAAGSAAVVCALVWHGPNSWPYAWLDGVAAAYVRPSLGGLTFDHPLLWLALVAVAVLIVRRVAPAARRRPSRRASGAARPRRVPRRVGGHRRRGLRRGGVPGHPTRLGVGAERRRSGGNALRCHRRRPRAGRGPRDDPRTGQRAGQRRGVLPRWRLLPGRPPTAGAGVGVADRPPRRVGDERLVRAARRIRHGLGHGLDTGPDATPVVLAAGNLAVGGGTTLTAVYGRSDGTDVTTLDRVDLGDDASSPHWRTFPLRPPAGADAVRIEAVDATGAQHGWLAFTAPALARAVPLPDLLPPPAPVALGWQVAFAHPCARPPAVVGGITEPATYAITRAADPDGPPLAGLADMAWQADRGGVYAHVPRSQSVLALPTVGPVDPYLRVYAFTSPLARDAYVLVPGGRTVSGADAGVGG